MNKEEIRFNEAKKDFNTSLGNVKKVVTAYEQAYREDREEMGISEADYIRLTRTIQLAERYLPRREITSANQNARTRRQFVFEKIIDAYRNVREKIHFKRSELDNEKYPSSYIMSEDLVGNLRKLRHYDYLLRHLNGENKQELEKILDNKLTGQLIRERREGPGILDDYRQSNWGVKRICLDGIQNHLPNDAKGTTCWLHFEIDGRWADAQEAKLFPEKVTKVRFADDGVGFTPDNLLYLHSTKGSEDDSVGQFGEGMKLASMASINLGLNMELQSRNWSALAVGEDKQLVNTRDNDRIEERKQLIYHIKEYDREPLIGSRTIFHSPTREFIDFALQLPEKVLELNPNYKPYFTIENTDVVSTSKGGQAFVKGIFVKELNSIFSYNFNKADVNPDRNQITGFDVETAISAIILELNDIRIIKTLIAKMIDYHRENPRKYLSEMPIEMRSGENLFYQFKNDDGVPSLWREAFKQVLEQKGATNADGKPIEAVLKTDYEVPEQLNENLAKFNVISLPKYWTMALQKAGVKTDRESLPEYIDEIIPTSLSLGTGEGIWNKEQMVLDAIQNHLPADCGGSKLFLRFQTSDGKWHDFSEFNQFDDLDIKKIKISDDGTGYDFKSLGIIASVKNHNVSSGKWGEGLKMLSAVAIRNGEKLMLHSRDWIAIPRTQNVILNQGEVNEQQVQQLVFEMIKKVNPGSNILDDGDNPQNGDHGYYKQCEKSSTTFVDPSPDLIREFRSVKEKVLGLKKKNAIAIVDNSEVLDLSSGNLYVRSILVPGNHNIKYGYHLGNFDIETRERNVIKIESLQDQLKNILERIDNERFISAFLRDAMVYAQGKNEAEYLEFTTPFTIPSETYQADAWIKVFKQDFGNKTSIRGRSDQDMNAVHQAQHLGLSMVTLPDSVARALEGLKGKDGQVITSYHKELSDSMSNIVQVPDEDLTDYEHYMIEHLYKYNKILASFGCEESIQCIKVYDYDNKYDGTRTDGFASKGNTINVNRRVLNGNLHRLGSVFFHEGDHAMTGARDADKKFRDFLTNLLSSVAMENIPIDKVERAYMMQRFPKEALNQNDLGGMAMQDTALVLSAETDTEEFADKVRK